MNILNLNATLALSLQQIAEDAKYRSFVLGGGSTVILGCCLMDAASQAREGQGLEPDMTGSPQGGKEEPFPAEDC